MTEAGFQAQVLDLAESLGLVVLHLRAPAREGSAWAGFPDLMIFAPGGGVMFRELKMPGKRLRAAQRDWESVLSGQDFGVWKPHDWHSGRIQRELHELAGEVYAESAPVTAQRRLWAALREEAER